MTEFLSDELWRTINSLAKTNKKKKIAVAYLGKGANEILTLQKGDILIINMSIRNIESGIVNPFEIEKYYKKGVLLFNCKNLHSKVYLFHDTVIVGSANISTNSKDNLIEAGIISNEKEVISSISKYLDNLCREEVTEGYINLCKTKYKEPKFQGSVKGLKLVQRPKIILSDLWVINIKLTVFTNEEEEILQNDLEKHIVKLEKDDSEIEGIRFGASSSFIRNVKEGDLVIKLLNDKKRTTVFQPMRVLGITKGRTTNSKGHGNMFVRIEEPIEHKKRSWSDFERYLIKNKIKNISKKSTKQVKDDITKNKLLDFFN